MISIDVKKNKQFQVLFNTVILAVCAAYLLLIHNTSFSGLFIAVAVCLPCFLFCTYFSLNSTSSTLLLSEQQPKDSKLYIGHKATQQVLQAIVSQQYSRISRIGIWLKIDIASIQPIEQTMRQDTMFLFVSKWQMSQQDYKSLCRLVLWHNSGE